MGGRVGAAVAAVNVSERRRLPCGSRSYLAS